MVRSLITVRAADAADLEPILRVQRRAFERVARHYGLDPSVLPPVRESLDDLLGLLNSGTRFFVAVDDGDTAVGSVRAHIAGDAVHVGRLVVDDGWLRRGVATMLMETLEAAHPGAVAFELFTAADAAAPLALYGKLGYRVTRRDESGPVALVWLEKRTAR